MRHRCLLLKSISKPDIVHAYHSLQFSTINPHVNEDFLYLILLISTILGKIVTLERMCGRLAQMVRAQS